MNIENVKIAIAVMQRAKARNSLYMPAWQHPIDRVCGTEAELHSCGNTACFGGHLAISPEWRSQGGGVNSDGQPTWGEYQEWESEDAIARFLDIDTTLANKFVYGNAGGDVSNFYGKEWGDVKADDVIRKLEELLNESN